jgi:hypothetical protein
MESKTRFAVKVGTSSWWGSEETFSQAMKNAAEIKRNLRKRGDKAKVLVVEITG